MRKQRAVPLSDEEWELFRQKGGGKWLRGLLKVEKMRDASIIRAINSGQTHKATAVAYGVSTKTTVKVMTQWRHNNPT